MKKTMLISFIALVLVVTLVDGRGKRCMFMGDNGENIVDLTWSLNNESQVHPVHMGKFTLTALPNPLPYYYQANRMELAEHSGTHIDAPNHFKEGGWAVDEIPLDNLMGRGVLIDMVKNGQPLEGNTDITVQDVLDWEAKHGKICCRRDIIFFRTGLGDFYESDPQRYLGTDDIEDWTTYKNPGISPKLADFLVKKRKVRVIGMDTMNIDTGHRKLFPAHLTLQGNDIVLIENVAHLDKLVDRPTGFHVLVMPIKVQHATGVPTRVVAIKDEI